MTLSPSRHAGWGLPRCHLTQRLFNLNQWHYLGLETPRPGTFKLRNQRRKHESCKQLQTATSLPKGEEGFLGPRTWPEQCPVRPMPDPPLVRERTTAAISGPVFQPSDLLPTTHQSIFLKCELKHTFLPLQIFHPFIINSAVSHTGQVADFWGAWQGNTSGKYGDCC